MLNRLMFTWFLQSKGFLDNDRLYLANRLAKIERGDLPGLTFHEFYKGFLRTLFRDGLNSNVRNANLIAQLGNVPYINGGIFEPHQLETDNPGIDIPNEAFRKLFEFFGQYTWHLDDRPLGNENEINPDVLGYIFEKFVNQKEKGAYYTKEDVTGYISQNTILPWLLDTARKECRIAFDPTQPTNAWQLLQETPEKYIYKSMKHGVIDEFNDELPMPEALVAGQHDYAQRQNWNQRATEPYALPTETWREYFHRRNRTIELRDKLKNGEIHEIDDLITWNLDIRQFAQDVVVNIGGVDLIRAFWKAIKDITILDPTVGSGAFLFAAVRVVEPLYTGLLERMTIEVDQAPSRALTDFRDVLEEAEKHPNRDYFVMRQIILNNLYGVDIEEEAVEICKLRLFLLLAAKLEEGKPIEPLPDIDFNIRAGNTLVGYATFDEITNVAKKATDFKLTQMALIQDNDAKRLAESAELADQALQKFKRIQDDPDHRADLPDAKQGYLKRITGLRNELNEYMYKQQQPGDEIESWRKRTQPFHWFAEFHSIVIGKGGFDVIIGNPPYVQLKDIKYQPNGFSTLSCGDIYALCVERALRKLIHREGRFSMIIPVSSISTAGYQPLREVYEGSKRSFYAANFAERPGKLFEGADKRLSIITASSNSTHFRIHNTKYRRWLDEERIHLMDSLHYLEVRPALFGIGGYAKIESSYEVSILEKLANVGKPVQQSLVSKGFPVRFTRKLRYFIQFYVDPPEKYDSNGHSVTPSELKQMDLASEVSRDAVIAVLNSSLFFWFFTAFSDCRNVNRREINLFPIGLDGMREESLSDLARLSRHLLQDLKANSVFQVRNDGRAGLQKLESFRPRQSKSIIDQIDYALAKHYGFSDDEVEFIISHDFKYRMGIEDEID